MKYSELVQKIRKYKRRSILDSGTYACWDVWQNGPTEINTIQSQEAFLIRAYASRIVAISAATGNDHRRSDANPDIILALCNDFLAVEDIHSRTDVFEEEEVAPMQKALLAIDFFKEHATDYDLIKKCAAQIFIQRLLRSQWEFRQHRPDSIVRSWMIFKALNERLQGAPEQLIEKMSGLNPKELPRIGFFIYSLAGLTKGEVPIGRISVREVKIAEEIRNRLNLSNDKIKKVARDFSINFSDLRTWHNKVSAEVEYYRKYSAHPFVVSPLLTDRTIGDYENLFYGPSPHHLVWKTKQYLVDSLAEAGLKNLRNELGLAREDYIKKFLKSLSNVEVIELNEVLHNPRHKYPDFLLKVRDKGLLIESKGALTSAWGVTLARPKDVAEMWRRLFEGISQCQDFIDNKDKYSFSNDISEIASIVCVSTEVLAEGAIFSLFGFESGLLSDRNAKNFEIMSLQQMEDYLLELGPEEVYCGIFNKWKNGLIEQSFSTFYNEYFKPKAKPYSDRTFMNSAAEELFPGINFNQSRRPFER